MEALHHYQFGKWRNMTQLFALDSRADYISVSDIVLRQLKSLNLIFKTLLIEFHR